MTIKEMLIENGFKMAGTSTGVYMTVYRREADNKIIYAIGDHLFTRTDIIEAVTVPCSYCGQTSIHKIGCRLSAIDLRIHPLEEEA